MDQLYIEKVLAGDSQAFKYFLQTYKHMAYSVAISIVKQEHLAEEVVQDAFLICYQTLAKFRSKSKFSTWLYRIVVNCSYTALRKIKIQTDVFEVHKHEVVFDFCSFENLVKQEREQLIQESLLKISSNEALALRLFYLEELSLLEIREITGWTETNIKTILHRGRKNMYTILSKLMKAEYDGIRR